MHKVSMLNCEIEKKTGVLDEILNLTESVSEGFPFYSENKI